MKNLFDELDNAVAALGSVSAALSKLKFRLREFIMTEKPLDDEVERLLSFSGDLPNGSPANDRRSGQSVALKLNKKKEKTINSNKEKYEELIKLKHGQGSIILKVRYNKNGSVYKLYEGRYTDSYGNRKSVYAKTQKECLKLLREAHPSSALKKGALPKSITVKEWMLNWYNDFKKENLKKSSREGYEIEMNAYIFPTIGNLKLRDLNGEILQKFFNSVKSGNTRKKLYLLVNACLKKAVILKKIATNPCEAVELPKFKKQKRRPFEYAEQQEILANANEKIRQVFFFLCVTGLRIGEFLALTKEDFYFENNFFFVNKAIVRGELTDTKTESSCRKVFFTDKLFDHFDLNLLGSFTYYALKNAVRKLFERLNIKNVSLHSTRHTFATVCHSFGMNDKVLQSLMGHSTLAMTQDVYTHLLKKGTSEIACYLQEFCTKICTTNI